MIRLLTSFVFDGILYVHSGSSYLFHRQKTIWVSLCHSLHPCTSRQIVKLLKWNIYVQRGARTWTNHACWYKNWKNYQFPWSWINTSAAINVWLQFFSMYHVTMGIRAGVISNTEFFQITSLWAFHTTRFILHVSYLQRNAPTSLIHFAQLYNKGL